MTTIPHPKIVSRDEWLAERKKLLAHEKELTKHRDRINAERRRLPMVKVEKDYLFDGPNGKQSLKALFDGRRQLIVYHFMFDPAWDKGCSGCTGEDVFHSYSTYARGTESLTDAYSLLDTTPYGRQQDFEDSPLNWPQKPTYG